jgi:hypothetical protein
MENQERRARYFGFVLLASFLAAASTLASSGP